MSTRAEVRQSVYDTFKNEPLTFSTIVTRVDGSSYNATTGEKTEISTSYGGYVLFKEIQEYKSIPKYYVIRDGDKACLFSGNGFEPKVNDIIVIDDLNYKVQLSIDTSVGSKALFFLIIR